MQSLNDTNAVWDLSLPQSLPSLADDEFIALLQKQFGVQPDQLNRDLFTPVKSASAVPPPTSTRRILLTVFRHPPRRAPHRVKKVAPVHLACPPSRARPPQGRVPSAILKCMRRSGLMINREMTSLLQRGRQTRRIWMTSRIQSLSILVCLFH